MFPSNDIRLSIAIVLVAIGFFCLGRYGQLWRTHHWRLRWIQVEHRLAFLQGRKPRKTEEMEKLDPCTPPPG